MFMSIMKINSLVHVNGVRVLIVELKHFSSHYNICKTHLETMVFPFRKKKDGMLESLLDNLEMKKNILHYSIYLRTTMAAKKKPYIHQLL